jgi:tol-pal system protein YbgF
MGLSTSRQILLVLRNVGFAFVVIALFSLTGCGGSEEATQGDQSGKPAESTEGKPKDEKPYDQALTNFVGDKKPEEAAKPVATAPSSEELQKQIDALKTENTDLSQKNLKLEDDARRLKAQLDDAEAKYAAEKDRADKAEEATKVAASQAMAEVKKTESMATARGAEIKTELTMPAYEEALSSFRSKKYDDAIGNLQKMLDEKVPDDVADNCHYWIGEALFAKKNYKDAVGSFESVLTYKRSEKKGDAQFMIAQSYERMGNKEKAKAAFERVVKDYPTSIHVKKAKERWAKL